MAAFGGHDYAGQSNPFSMPDPTNPMNASANRHGSAEQVGAAQTDSNDTYLGSMGGATPRASSPRSPRGVRPGRARARSEAHVREEDEDYQDRRAERQESRREPVGMGFRINACEQTLRTHHDELTAQRLAIQQITEALQQNMVDKGATGQRLDEVFSLADTRFAESQSAFNEIVNGTQQRYDTMINTINSMSHAV